MLREYAAKGCPVSVGRDWILEELEAAAERGPHKSALKPDAIAQIQVEAREKEAQGFCKLYNWEKLKSNLPKKLKLSASTGNPRRGSDTLVSRHYVDQGPLDSRNSEVPGRSDPPRSGSDAQYAQWQSVDQGPHECCNSEVPTGSNPPGSGNDARVVHGRYVDRRF